MNFMYIMNSRIHRFIACGMLLHSFTCNGSHALLVPSAGSKFASILSHLSLSMVSFSGSQHAHTCREILVSGCLGAVSWGGFAWVNIVGMADEFSFFVWSSQLELRLIKTYLHLAKNTSIPICFAITERYIYCSIGIAYSYIGFW